MEVELRARAAIEEATQQCQSLRQRAKITDYDTQFALFAHRKLGRVRLERAQLLQEDAGALVKRSSRLGEADAVAAAVKEAQSQLLFELSYRQED